MTGNPVHWALLGLFGLMESVLAYNLSQATQSPYMGWKLGLLWVLAAGFHYLGFTTLSRFALAIALTALASPFFLGKGIYFGHLSLFNWMGIFLALLMVLAWRESSARVSKPQINTTLLLILFLGVPVLIFFQLNPLLEEVYAQPLPASITNFLPIPLGFCTFLLALNLRRNAALFICLGLPLLIPLFTGLAR